MLCACVCVFAWVFASVNGLSFRSLAEFNDLVLAGSHHVVLELVRLGEADVTAKHRAEEQFVVRR